MEKKATIIQQNLLTESTMIEDLGDELQSRIDSLLGSSGKIELAIRTDLTPRGTFAPGCVVATENRLVSCSKLNGGLDIHADIPRNKIGSVERIDTHSLCRLQVHTADEAVRIALFPRSRIGDFDAASRHLTVSAKRDEEKPVHSKGRYEKRRDESCAKCGKVFPKRLGFCPDCLDRGQLLLRLMSLARPYVVPMASGLGFMLVITIIEMAQPVLTKILVDNVIPNSDLHLFAWIIAGIVAIQVFSSLFSGSRSYLMAWLGEKIVHDLRTKVYAHVQSLSMQFYDERQTGWIMDRVSADTGNLQNFLSEGFQDFLRDLMAVLVILGIMFGMNWQLTMITLIPAPFVFFLTARFMRKTHRLFHSVWRKRAYMTALLSNVIPGVRVVKAFAQERNEALRFTERSQMFMEASVRTARTFATFHPITGFITSLGFIMVWSVGGYLVISGKGVTVGTLIAFISFLWRFYGPLNNLSRFSQRFERATTSAQRIFDVLDTRPGITDTGDADELPEVQGAVEFEQVTFGYNPDEPVLKDVSFTVKPGEMIGLVGPSGAGKSTMINLLCRLYDTSEGAITIDGHDIRSVTQESLHRQIGVVLQEPFLFHGTIAENIAYGKPDAIREEIMRAADAANAHPFIMNLPEGYDTLVGERGQRLSGGERQRIAIARAILKDPRILILDEATSSVDVETEAAIQEAIERLVKGRTTIAIAHRFSTLRNADRLVVLDKGRVVEIGTHEELLAKEDGMFRRLVDIQARSSQIVAIGG